MSDEIIIILLILLIIILIKKKSTYKPRRKVAVCFFGRITTWENNTTPMLKIIEESLDCDIECFASIHETPDSDEANGFIDLIKPVKYNIEKIDPEPGLEVFLQKKVSAFYHRRKVVQLVAESGNKYDWVITGRADHVNPHKFDFIDELPDENTLYTPATEFKNWWSVDRIGDQIDAGGLESMIKFTNIYENDRLTRSDIESEKAIYIHLKETNLQNKEFLWNVRLDPERGGVKSNNYDK